MIRITTTRKIGNKSYHISTEGNTLFEAVIEENKLPQGDIEKCGKCGGTDLSLRAYETKEGYEYLKVQCRKCKASLGTGKAKRDNAMYYKRKEDYSLDWQEKPA
jgi:hypothetical protein